MAKWKWTDVVKGAFDFIKSGFERGLDVFKIFSSIKGEFRGLDFDTTDAIFSSIKSISEDWTRIEDIPPSYLVRESFAHPIGFDYRQKHIMEMKIYGKDLVTREEGERWITVESDREMTRAEWDFYATQAIENSVGSNPTDIYEILEYNYYIKE